MLSFAKGALCALPQHVNAKSIAATNSLCYKLNYLAQHYFRIFNYKGYLTGIKMKIKFPLDFAVLNKVWGVLIVKQHCHMQCRVSDCLLYFTHLLLLADTHLIGSFIKL